MTKDNEAVADGASAGVVLERIVSFWTPGIDAKILAKNIIENPNEWENAAHTFNHKKSGKRIWVSNGVNFIDFYPETKAFSRVERRLIFNAIKKAMVKQAICLES